MSISQNKLPENEFLLEILSPDGVIYQETVEAVILPTVQGEITVLPHHAPIFTKLTEGEIVINNGGKKFYIAISGGFLEVNKHSVNVLADYAVRSEKIETKKAEDAKKKAEELIKQKEKMGEFDFAMVEKELQKSILELKISDKVRKRIRQ